MSLQGALPCGKSSKFGYISDGGGGGGLLGWLLFSRLLLYEDEDKLNIHII